MSATKRLSLLAWDFNLIRDIYCMMGKLLKLLVLVFATQIIAACGGGGSSTTTEPAFAFSPGGIWEQSVSSSGLPDFVIDEEGRALVQSTMVTVSNLGADAGFIAGTGQITESDSEGIQGEFIMDGFIFDDVASTTTTFFATECTATGTLVERISLFLSLDCEIEEGVSTLFIFSLVASQDCSDIACSNSETVYETAFSLSDIAGTYNLDIPVSFGFVNNRGSDEIPETTVGPANQIEISASGSITGTDEMIQAFGCDFSGQVSLLENGFNLFEMVLTTENCIVPDSIAPDSTIELDPSITEGLMFVRASGDSISLRLLSEPIVLGAGEAAIPFGPVTVYDRITETGL